MVLSTVPAEIRDGAIILPTQAVDRPVQGKVVHAGRDSEYKIGDEVLVAKFTGKTAMQNMSDYYAVFRDEEVLGTIEKLA